MTDAPVPQPAGKTPLGIGDILSSTFSLYFSRFAYFFGIFFIPYLAVQVLALAMGYGAGGIGEGATVAATAVVTILSFVVFFAVQAVQVRSAITMKLGQGVQFAPAVQAALAGIIPIILLGVIAGIAMGLGFILLVVPGLYLVAMFYVYIPAIVFERAGFGALGRSIELTSGYRWSIVGLVLVFMVLFILAGLLIGAISVGILAGTGGFGGALYGEMGMPALVAYTVLDAIANAIVTPIGMIAAGLVYARLKEIKDGGSSEALLKIFE